MIFSLNSSQCYKLLGLDEGASLNEIKNAYRRLALEYHPDKNIAAKDGIKFRMISEAYHTLRVKNNVHVSGNHKTEHNTVNKNRQYIKNNFLIWLNFLYSKMDHMYVKNVQGYHLKYEPVLSEYYYRIKRNAPIIIYRLIRLFQHNHIIIFSRIITESTRNLTKNITKTIRW